MLDAKAERLLRMLEAWGWTVCPERTWDDWIVVVVEDVPMGVEILEAVAPVDGEGG